jgi:hypothetical protein
MDERPDQIIGHIEAQRDQLGRNLNELETRVRQTADWRTWFNRNPMMVMGAALGGGLLVGSMVAGKTSGVKRRRTQGAEHRTRGEHMRTEMGASTAGVAAASSMYSAEHTRGDRAGEGKLKSTVSSLKRSESWHQVSDTLDDVKCALIAFGIAKTREFLTQAIPGFEQHLHEAQHKRESRAGQSQHTRPAESDSTWSGEEQETHPASDTGHRLYTPTGEHIVRSGSYTSDPVGTYRP